MQHPRIAVPVLRKLLERESARERAREREREHTYVLHTWKHDRTAKLRHATPQTRQYHSQATTRKFTDKGCLYTHRCVLILDTQTCVVFSNTLIIHLSLTPPQLSLSLCFVCLYSTLMRLSKASTLVCKRARRAAGSCFSASAAVFSMLAKSHVVYSSSTLNRFEKLFPDMRQYPCVRVSVVCVRACRLVSM